MFNITSKAIKVTVLWQYRDKVALIVYWLMCTKLGMEHQKEGYEHVQEQVLGKNNVKLFGDFPIQTDNPINHNKLDLVPNTSQREMLNLNHVGRTRDPLWG